MPKPDNDYRFENDPYLKTRTPEEKAYSKHMAYSFMRRRGVKPEDLDYAPDRAAYANWLKANPQ